MIDNKATQLQTHHFHLNGEKGIYQVTFSIDDDNIESACDCSYQSDKRLCWHRYYILAGKKYRLPPEEHLQQDAVIQRLSKTPGGRGLISTAKATFGEKETCRRCNKTEVVDLKKSIFGKIISIFLPRGRRYFCWSCRWSW